MTCYGKRLAHSGQTEQAYVAAKQETLLTSALPAFARNIAAAFFTREPHLAMSQPVRIVFFTNATTHESLPVLKALSESEQVEILQVVLYNRVPISLGRLRARIRQHGLKRTLSNVANGIAAKLAAPTSDSNSGTSTSRTYAEDNNLPIRQVTSVNSPDVLQYMRTLQPDLFVVCALSEIIKPDLLQVPRLTAINVHPSLLPKYRGPAPVFWALYHREAETGITFHAIDSRIDNGAIIDQFRVPLHPNAPLDDVTRQLFSIAGEHIVNAVVGVGRDEKEFSPQKKEDATYFSMPSLAQRQELSRRTTTQ
ncbi:MAG: hypothetical protein JXQ99_07835 [Hyphomicrobiaceae bacterium]